MSELCNQVKKLMEDGLSMAEAAEALNLEPQAVALALKGEARNVITAHKLIEEFRTDAIEILKDIARNSENDHARVRAVDILLNGKGIAPEVNASQLSERLKRMRELNSKVINVEVVSETKELQLANA